MARNRDMACQELVELVTDYLEGTLPTRDRARLEAHLRGCDGCTEYLAQMRRTIQVAGRLTAESLDPAAQASLMEVFRRWKAG